MSYVYVIKHSELRKCAIELYYIIFLSFKHMDVNNFKSTRTRKIK